MTDDEDAELGNLSGRLSYGAWVALRAVRQHPRFTELISDLERIQGMLTVLDVERALKRF